MTDTQVPAGQEQGVSRFRQADHTLLPLLRLLVLVLVLFLFFFLFLRRIREGGRQGGRGREGGGSRGRGGRETEDFLGGVQGGTHLRGGREGGREERRKGMMRQVS
jgi:hypothetical protein